MWIGSKLLNRNAVEAELDAIGPTWPQAACAGAFLAGSRSHGSGIAVGYTARAHVDILSKLRTYEKACI